MTATATAPLATGRRARRTHALSAQALDQAGRLMLFNWLLAAYAHPDWLGPWAELLAPSDNADMRLLRRASLALLARHDLQERFLRKADVEAHPWLLVSAKRLQPVAQELGVAMLGGWVRTRLEREHVAQQRLVLDTQQRRAAMHHAASLRALPYAEGSGWPLSRLEPGAVPELGLSCMAALLDDPHSGARERFTMQFARGVIVPLALNEVQRREATTLIQHQLRALQGQGHQQGGPRSADAAPATGPTPTPSLQGAPA